MAAAPLRVAAICGSLRQDSLNRQALQLAANALPAGTQVDWLEIRDIPPFDSDVLAPGIPGVIADLASQVRRCDGVIIATPEYNFSIPGVLKNALDWLSRAEQQPFQRKPVAILSASAGPLGGARVQYDLRKVLQFLEAMVLQKPEVFIGTAPAKFAGGTCSDEPTRKVVGDQMSAFVNWIRAVQRING